MLVAAGLLVSLVLGCELVSLELGCDVVVPESVVGGVDGLDGSSDEVGVGCGAGSCFLVWLAVRIELATLLMGMDSPQENGSKVDGVTTHAKKASIEMLTRMFSLSRRPPSNKRNDGMQR